MRACLPALVLTAHEIFCNVAPASAAEANTAYSDAALAETLRGIKTLGYEFATFNDFMERRRDGGVALLTFDDACKSVLRTASPILSAEKVPAVVFVITGATFGDRDPFPIWLHVLRDRKHLLKEGTSAPLLSHPLINRVLASCGSISLDQLLLRPLSASTEAFWKVLTSPQLRQLAEIVASLPGFGRATMDEKELCELTQPGKNIEVGAHSVTHRSFSHLGNSEIYAELTLAAQTIANWSGKPPSSLPFAYPYGAVTAYAARLVSSIYRAGFTCHSRPLSMFDPAATLPRINLDSSTMDIAQERDSVTRLMALVGEKVKLHIRTGPAWRIIGPMRSGLRAWVGNK